MYQRGGAVENQCTEETTMMEISASGPDASLLPPGSIITVPIITSDAGVSASGDCGTATIINVPLMRDGAFLKAISTSQGFVLTAGPDGPGTVFLDPSQFVLTQNDQPIGEFVPLESANLGESGEEPGCSTEQISKPLSLPHKLNADIQPPVGKGPFRCETCGKVFSKWNQLKRHSKIHADDKPYRCDRCDVSFNIESNLILHKATHNRESSVCPECGKRFSRVASLKAHIMLHEKEENLVCTECGDEFHTQGQLDKHVRKHSEQPVGHRVYGCKHCSQVFSRACLFREHMRTHYRIRASLSHRTYKRNIDRSQFSHKCKNCGKSFQKPSQLERHMRIHTGERPYVCDQCNKSFNQKGALQIHLTKHSGERPYRCEFCPAAFSQKGNLRAHIQRVHAISKGSDQPVYSCEECSCVFRKLGSLNAHMSRMHAEDGEVHPSANFKQVEVPTISSNGKAVKDVIKQLIVLSEQTEGGNSKSDSLNPALQVNSDILQQALQNSGLTNVQGEQNALGGKRRLVSVTSGTMLMTNGVSPSNDGATASSLMTYADSATGVFKRHLIKKVGGVRWHQCLYCVKEFKKPSDLVRHIRIHTHEKPYKCPQCFRSFTVKSTLTAHIRTHSGVKEFHCEVCEKLFSTQGSLKVHLRLHTGAKPFVCPVCDKRFRTSGHRKSHMLSHTKDGRKSATSASCDGGVGGGNNGSSNTEPRRCRRFVRKVSRNNESLPDIPLQEPILITDSGLVQVAPKGSRAFGELFAEPPNLERPYKCAFCGRAFKKSSHLKQHIRSHTGEKPYKCNQCGRNFVSGGVLKAHMRTHTGVKAYRCNICDSTFTTNGSLKRHMSTHSEIRPFMCPYCQKTFKTSVNCKKHMKIHKHELALQAVQATTAETANTVSIVDSVLNHHLQDGTARSLHQQPQQQPDNHDPTNVLGSQGVILSDTLTQLHQSLGQHVFSDHNPLGDVDLASKTLQVQAFDQQTFEHFSSGTFTLQSDNFSQTLDIVGLDQALVGASNIPSSLMNARVEPASHDLCDHLEVDEEDEDEDDGLEHPMSDAEPKLASIAEDMGDKKIHKCVYCDRAFERPSKLKQHLRTHTGERPFRCSQCDRMFVSSGVLKAHLKTHLGTKDFKCQICRAEFTTNGSLTRHMMIHSSVKPFKCVYCNETFRTHLHCKRHMKLHVGCLANGAQAVSSDDALSKKARGQVIQFSDEQTDNLAKQMPDECYSVSEKILIASAVEKDRVSEIKDRMSELEQLPKHQHQCHQCPKSFKKPSDLVRHLRIHTGEKPFQCHLCQKSFTVKSTLDSHLKTHSGEKLFGCHVCNSMFATKGSLKVHMRLHTGAKPFKCPHCELRFRTSGHRKSHIGTHLKLGSMRKRRMPQFSAPSDGELDIVCDDAREEDEEEDMSAAEDKMAEAPLQAVSNMDQITLNSNLLQLDPNPGGTLQNITLSVDGLNSDGGHLLSSSDGVHLQLGQGLQIAGLDSVLAQTIQIDASILQQLQQQGNVNITINSNLLAPLGGPVEIPTAAESCSVSVGTQTSSPLSTSASGVVLQPMSISLPTNISGLHPMDPDAISDSGTEVSSSYQLPLTIADNDVCFGGGDLCKDSTEVNLNIMESGEMLTKVQQMVAPSESRSEEEEEESGGRQLRREGAASASRAYVCSVCSKAFKRAAHLKEHLLTHGPRRGLPKPTPHGCNVCCKRFAKPSQLERHLRIHTGERPFVCSVCDRAFNQKNALQIHMNKHTGEKPYLCPFCNQAFAQKGNVRVHVRRVHTKDQVDDVLLDCPVMDSASLGAAGGLGDDDDDDEGDGNREGAGGGTFW